MGVRARLHVSAKKLPCEGGVCDESKNQVIKSNQSKNYHAYCQMREKFDFKVCCPLMDTDRAHASVALPALSAASTATARAHIGAKGPVYSRREKEPEERPRAHPSVLGWRANPKDCTSDPALNPKSSDPSPTPALRQR